MRKESTTIPVSYTHLDVYKRQLYAFKEELEQSEDRQAKEVLVDVYDRLDFKKDAYELLCQIGDRSNKKTLKRLGTLKMCIRDSL